MTSFLFWLLLLFTPHAHAAVLLDNTVAPISPAEALDYSVDYANVGSIGTTTIGSVVAYPMYTTSHFFTQGNGTRVHMTITDSIYICTSVNSFPKSMMTLNVNGIPNYGVLDGSLDWYGFPTPMEWSFANCQLNTTTSGGLLQVQWRDDIGNQAYFDAETVAAGTDGYHNPYLIVSTEPGTASTYISTVLPADGDLVASSTPFTIEADGAVGIGDAIDSGPAYGNDGLSVLWTIQPLFNTCNSVLCAFESAQSSYRSFPIIVGTSSQLWYVATTSHIYSQDGPYQLTAQLQRPYTFLGTTNVLGFYWGYTTLAEKTSTFTVGTSTELGNFMLNLRGQPKTALASTSPNVCIPVPGLFSASDCSKMLFIPDQIPNYGANWEAIQNKPPFGYFRTVATILGGASTSTASTTASGLTIFGTIFTPFRIFFGMLIWLVFLIWIFKRTSHFQL